MVVLWTLSMLSLLRIMYESHVAESWFAACRISYDTKDMQCQFGEPIAALFFMCIDALPHFNGMCFLILLHCETMSWQYDHGDLPSLWPFPSILREP